MKKLFYTTLIGLFSFTGNCQLFGEWHSSFIVMGMSTRLSMNIAEDSIIQLSSPDEEFPSAKMNRIEINDDSIKFQWTALNLKFAGKYHRKKDEITGEMHQAGISWETLFTRELREKLTVNRPQEVSDSVTYFTEDVEVQNGEIILGATVSLPEGYDASTPIVILASGSGPQNRDCELMGHKPFKVIADHLARNGVGCLRFDDRGMGSSGGEFSKATLSDFASDINACFDFLKKNGYAKNPVGVAGHSEGGMHALIAASKNKELAFVIELASVGTNGKDILVEQQYLIPLQAGKTEGYAEFNRRAFNDASEIISTVDEGSAGDSLSNHLARIYEDAPDDYKAETNKFIFIMNINNLLNNDWGREFLQFQADTYLRQLKVPMMTVNGEKDIQVPGKSNYDAFRNFKYTSKAKKQNKYILADGLNHLMQQCTTCTIEEYGEIGETFSVKILEDMSRWIKSLQ
ncbi:MAG: alpha/beta hydrolase family protein [Crocinitomicaceae bacterium]